MATDIPRAPQSAFAADFAGAGAFPPKTVHGRRYSYFQDTEADGSKRPHEPAAAWKEAAGRGK